MEGVGPYSHLCGHLAKREFSPGPEVLQGPPGVNWMPDFPWGTGLIFVQNRAVPRLVPRRPRHTKRRLNQIQKFGFVGESVCVCVAGVEGEGGGEEGEEGEEMRW